MSDKGPFRDGMGAALMRIDQLADENEELRDELDRLRHAAGAIKSQSSDHHANALADQTLALLDRLDTRSQREPRLARATTAASAEAGATFQPPANLEVHHADAEVLLSPGRRPLVAPALRPTPPSQQSVAHARWAAACVACFSAGVLLGALLH